MFKLIPFIKKITLAALVLAIGLAVLPTFGASAAGLDNQTALPSNQAVNNTRLEQVWARAQAVYQRQGDRLSKADTFIARVQSLIDKATAKGWDTSAVQDALDALTAVIPAVQAAHDPGAAIIASHNGFDASGKVIDRTAAIATAKSLVQVLKDTRTAMNGTVKELHDAVKAYRQAHPHTANTTSLTPSSTPTP